MNIELLRKLSEKPKLYEQGTSVMWTDPHISRQLLELHIHPYHDIASRSKAKIEHITDWILKQTSKDNLEILDLGCGPGLYAELLAQRGHAVTGVDFSENSIRYATVQAREKNLNINYRHMNYLELDLDHHFDLVILIYLDFCALLPEDRDTLIEIVHRALKQEGIFVFDVVNDRNIDHKIMPASWDVVDSGFWKNTPYIALNKGYHFPEAKVWANKHVVIGEDDNIETYIFWNHYYSTKEMVPLLQGKGFTGIKNFEHVLPDADDYWNGENVTFYVARK